MSGFFYFQTERSLLCVLRRVAGRTNVMNAAGHIVVGGVVVACSMRVGRF